MANLQLFDNNAESTLLSGITAVATTVTVQSGDGALWQLVSSPNYSLATIEEEGVGIEIVKITSHDPGGGSPDNFTIERAQEGTVALAFSAGAQFATRNTAGTLNLFPQFDFGGDAKGTYSTNLQPYRGSADQVASGYSAIAIGQSSKASGSHSIAIGTSNEASQGDAIAIGRDARATYGDGIAIGRYADALNDKAVAIGERADVTGQYGVAIGYSADATSGAYGIAIGAQSQMFGAQGIAIGYQANAYGTRSIAIGRSTYVGGDDNLGIGDNVTVFDAFNKQIAIGDEAIARGDYVIAIGALITNDGSHDYSIILGSRAYIEAGSRNLLLGERTKKYGSGADNILIGTQAEVRSTASKNIVIGGQAYHDAGGESNEQNIVIGWQAYISGYDSNECIAIGGQASCYGGNARNIAIGPDCNVGGGNDNTAIAADSDINGARNVAIGRNTDMTGSDRIAVGYQAKANVDKTANISAPLMVKADDGSGLAGFIHRFAGAEVMLLSGEYDMTTANPFGVFPSPPSNNANLWTFGSGARFYPEQVGVVTTNVSGVTTGPTISFGIGTTGTQLLNNQVFSNPANGQEQWLYASLNPNTGQGTLSVYLNSAATATYWDTRFAWRGSLIGY